MKESLQLYLPASTNKDFLKLVLIGTKSLLKLSEVKWVSAPHFDEISVASLYPKFSKDPALMRYFQDQYPRNKLPDRSYFFKVLNTVHEGRVQEMIRHANKQRIAAAECGISEDAVVVSKEWWQRLNEMPFMSCK